MALSSEAWWKNVNDLTEEERERADAWNEYYYTNDMTKLIELGIFPDPRDEGDDGQTTDMPKRRKPRENAR